MPILVTFWSQAIPGTGGYVKKLTKINLHINQQETLTPELFKIWLYLFYTTVNSNFSREKADKIKTQALSIHHHAKKNSPKN